MFYIGKPRTLSFPIRLVKTEFCFIVRWVETGLGRWMLVVVLIHVGAFPFSGFLRPDLSPWRYGNVFRLHCASLQLFLVVWIFLRFLGVICSDGWVLSEDHKNYFKDWCLINSQPTFLLLTYLSLVYIMAILLKACNPDNFE